MLQEEKHLLNRDHNSVEFIRHHPVDCVIWTLFWGSERKMKEKLKHDARTFQRCQFNIDASLLTGTAEGPASAVVIHQPPPQMTLPAGRGLVHGDRNASKSGVADFHSGHDPSAWLRLHHALEAFRARPDRLDVVVKAQPRLQRGLKTEKGRGKI